MLISLLKVVDVTSRKRQGVENTKIGSIRAIQYERRSLHPVRFGHSLPNYLHTEPDLQKENYKIGFCHRNKKEQSKSILMGRLAH